MGKRMRQLLPADLYNCCTHRKEPDWSRYCRLEISGSRDDIANRGSTIGGLSAIDARFFTIYGVIAGSEPEVEAITDIHGTPGARDQANGLGPARMAFAVAAELSRISGLDCIIRMSPPRRDWIKISAE